MSNTSVHVVFPSTPDCFRVTGKIREMHRESILNYIQKDWFSWRTFTPYNQCLMNFPSSIFLSTQKGNTKIWLYTGGWRRQPSRVSYFSLGISFQWLCQSRSNPPVVNCAPIPKMVPHSLNEQKCIGELVRAGCECLWGLRWGQAH